MSKTRYSKDWKQIATAVKDASDWRCSGSAIAYPHFPVVIALLSADAVISV